VFGEVSHLIVKIGFKGLERFVELELNNMVEVLDFQEFTGGFVIEQHSFIRYQDHPQEIFSPHLAEEAIPETDIRAVLL